MKPPIFTSYDIANQLCWFAEYNKGGFFCEAYSGKATVAKAHSKTPDPSLRELRSRLATFGGLSAFRMCFGVKNLIYQ
jgi:hypothetical protein